MANLDLMSYERNSRWMPHLSWAYPDLTLQQRMEQQAAERQQAWQKIADKLGPLLIGSDIGGSYGQSDYISRDICEDQEYLDRAYEKAPLLSSAKYPSSVSRSQKHSMSRSTNYNNTNTNFSQQENQKFAITNQTRNNTSNSNITRNSSQRNSNLNLYAQSHLVQMPQRGSYQNLHHLQQQQQQQQQHQQHMKQNPYHKSSGNSQLFVLLSVLLFMLLLLLFSLLLFFFYFDN